MTQHTTTEATNATTTDERELVISRLLDAPRSLVWQAWTDPRHVAAWWGPHGTTTPVCEMDVRPGGVFKTLMRDGDGNEYPTAHLFLEVAEGERLVFTDAYEPGWKPSEKPFLTVVLAFEEAEGGTLLTSTARHWSVADRQTHEEMGFYDGWGQSLEKFEAVVANLVQQQGA
ncbi:MAG TPA: SRPBCC family protein [Herpetosiphonaceae bacterium]